MAESALITKRVRCPRCSAMNEKTASTACRPIQDCTGEYECPMSDWPTDADGWFIRTAREKPLFLPLCAKYYDAFVAGAKNTEYRLEGPRWSLKNCHSGRQVILSRGYGKQNRARTTIRDVWIVPAKSLPGLLRLSLKELFGNRITPETRVIAILMNDIEVIE